MSAAVVLSEADLEHMLELDKVATIVREGFIALAEGRAVMFPLIREALGVGMFGLRSGSWPERGVLGLKVSGYHPGNVDRAVDRHQSCVVLVDPNSGHALGFVNGNPVTRIRTAAAGAIGTVALARPDARIVVVVGNGTQAEEQVVSHASLLAARSPEFLIYAPRDDAERSKATSLIDRLGGRGIRVKAASGLSEALSEADVVVTATAARSPLVELSDLSAGTHLTAIGADAPGKRELDDALIRSARIVVDDVAQALSNGESQYLGESDRDSIVTLGDVLRGVAGGRQGDDEITVFDSTGLSIHDLAVAADAMAHAGEREIGIRISI